MPPTDTKAKPVKRAPGRRRSRPSRDESLAAAVSWRGGIRPSEPWGSGYLAIHPLFRVGTSSHNGADSAVWLAVARVPGGARHMVLAIGRGRMSRLHESEDLSAAVAAAVEGLCAEPGARIDPSPALRRAYKEAVANERQRQDAKI